MVPGLSSFFSSLGAHALQLAHVDTLLRERLHQLTHVLFTDDLHQALEERHAEHLVLTFVNRRSEVLVNVITDDMPLEEGAPTVRLERQNHGFHHGVGAEDLGDHALQLATITVIEQRSAPVAQRVGADDQSRHTRDTSLDQTALADLLTVGAAELIHSRMLSSSRRSMPPLRAAMATRPRFRPW